MLNLFQYLPLPNQIQEKTLLITTENRETLKSIYWPPYNNTTGHRQMVGAAVHQGRLLFITAKAFTLIELLVVVLIIGILAAIAVPYYQKATERVKIVEATFNLRAIAEANHRYYMANGVYIRESGIDKLDVQIPG